MNCRFLEDGRFVYEKRGREQTYEAELGEECESFRKFLGKRKLRVLLLPVCSLSFIEKLLEDYEQLSRIIVLFPNQELLDSWASISSVDERLDLVLFDDEKSLHSSLESSQAALCEASILAYFPERFRRYDREFQHKVESDLLKLLQVAASQVAYKTFRSWHEALNSLTNFQGASSRKFLEKKMGGRFVIVGAGPSLDDTVASLKCYEDRAWIIVCDASVRTVLNAGIKPDFVVTLESHYGSSRFFDGLEDELSDVPLVHYTTSNPNLLKAYLGPQLVVKNFSEDHYFAEFNKGIEYLYAGTCVGHVAFSFAELCGASEIVMTGFDLAYKGDAFHCSAMSTKYYEDGDCANPTMVPGALGGELRTDASMKSFLDIFERQIEQSSALVVDATEGGALKQGTKISTLEAALSQGACLDKSDYVLGEGLRRSFSLADFVTSLEKYREDFELFLKDYLVGEMEALFLAEFCSFRQLLFLRELGRSSVDLEVLKKELSEALKLVDQYSRCQEERMTVAGRYVLFTDGGLGSEKLVASYPDFDFVEESCDGDLVKAWVCLLNAGAEGIVFQDSLLPPEAWMIPRVKAIEVKVSQESKHYEFCAWSEAYEILASRDCVDYWRSKLPANLSVCAMA